MMDLEKIVYAPIYIALGFIGFLNIYFDILMTPPPWDFQTSLFMIEKSLIIISYIFGAIFLLVRSRAVAESRSFRSKAVAYIAIFIPFLLSFEKNDEGIIVPTILSVSLVIAGVSFTIYSLTILRRSFSIAPQVRKLVRRGPYRFIRHPMYVGEAIAFTGVLMARLSILRIFTFLLLILVQVYRSLQEEMLLEEHIPDYSFYKKETKRFIPKLI